METVLGAYLLNSLILSVLVGLGVTIGGVGAAWLVTMCRFWGRPVLEILLVLPLAMPAYVLAYVYTDFLQFAGPVQSGLRALTGWEHGEYWFPNIRSLPGAAMLFVFVLYPYVYLLARANFLEQSVCVLEVSRSLGHGPWSTFARVALPLARPAIAAGVALALMETLADYGTVAYFGLPTFTTGIYRAWISMGDTVAAGQLASALLGTIAIIVLIERVSRGRQRFHHTSQHLRPLPAHHLTGWRAAGAIAFCTLPFLLGFVLPALLLIELWLGTGRGMMSERFLAAFGNSLLLGLGAGAIAVGVALGLALARRFSGSPLVQAASSLGALGYAVPGSVIAAGVLLPFAAIDETLGALGEALTGAPVGLVISGSIAGLLFAYVVRFLAVALQSVEAGLGRVTPHMEDAARALARGPVDAFARVHLPIIAPSLLTAALIVFVDVMKELPATLLLRPFNVETLAVQAYHFAADERLSEAGLPALAIVVAGLVPVILLMREIAGARVGGGAASGAVPVAAA
ncbi:MAG: ABC transporter permease subunit [Alphaproteobacteria bacterium]|nr:ABC transporter permease subunit [Alphaproteobacteria bacterium]